MRPLAAVAWSKYCIGTGENAADKCAHRKWWESICGAAARDQSVTTSRDLSPRQWDALMAELEMIAGAGAYWQTALLEGDIRRLKWRLARLPGDAGNRWLARFRNDGALAVYCAGIASQAFPEAWPKAPPFLYLLTDSQWETVANAATRAAHRS